MKQNTKSCPLQATPAAMRKSECREAFRPHRQHLGALAFALLLTMPFARAAIVTVPGLTTSDTTRVIGLPDTIGTESSAGTGAIIADGARLTITRPTGAANGRLFAGAAFDGITTLNITGTNGGRVIFRDINYAKNDTQASVSALGDLKALTSFNVTSVDFINNSSGGPPKGYPGAGANAYNGLAGVFNFNRAGLTSTFTDVLIEGNWSWGEGGVARIQTGSVIFNDVIVRNNYTRGSKNSGALTFNSNATFTMRGGSMEGNRTASQGGAIGFATASSSVVTLNDVAISDNWAANAGGVFMNNSGNVRVVINITSTAAANWLYSGNIAGNEAISASNNSTSGWHMTPDIGSNMVNNVAPTASAKRGGFFWGNNNGGQVTFDIASAHTLTIGAAGRPDEDTFATTTTHILRKQGAGDLVLNSNNSYWMGRVFVNAGRLMLGNNDAKLGGTFTLLASGTLGGSGTLVTYNQSDALQATTVTMNGNGSTLLVGNGSPGDKLTLRGTLTGSNGSIFQFDLFENNQSSQFTADTFDILGTGTIKLGSVASGTFTLLSWDNSNLTDASQLVLAGVSSARVTSAGTLLSNAYQLEVTLANSLNLTWTGAAGDLWQVNGAQANWDGVTSGGAVTDFQNGDTVHFDATGANRSIRIDSAAVSAVAVNISGAADYGFTGGTIATTGALTKGGSGRVTFANEGNAFAGGLVLNDGQIAISTPAQLGARLSDLAFGGAAGAAPRLVALDDLTFTHAGAPGDAGRLALASAVDSASAVNGGILVGSEKTLALKNIASTSGGGAIFVGDYNTFEIASETAGGAMSVLFEGNSSGAGGGALQTGANSVTRLDNAVFTSNAATANGGAIHNSGTLTLALASSATYSGNTAASGGFVYQNGAAARLTLDVADGATLVVGSESDISKDTFASGDIASIITKTGSGSLVLHGDSGAYTAAFNVDGGSLFLGHAGAKLGGTVTVRDGVTVGGLGSFAGTLNLDAGSVLQVGNDAAVASSLDIGTLNLAGGTLLLDLYAGGTSDKLNIGVLASVSGGNVIDVNGFRFGEHVIAGIGTGAALLDSGTVSVTIGGRAQAGARQSMTLSTSGTNVLLTGISDSSRILTWTGAGVLNTVWDSENTNWTDSASVNRFGEGDRVVFDASSPAATHDISIAGSSIAVSDIIVRGDADYKISGGAIIADAGRLISGVITGATGKLTKDGAGKLTLANDGVNEFVGGIDLVAGTLALASTGASGTGAINVTGANATLQAALADLEIDNALNLGANTLTLDTQANNTTLSGAVAGTGVLAKAGAGKLTLAGASAFAGTVRLDAGELALASNNALGAASSRLVVNNANARASLAADGLAITNDIDLGANTLTFDTLDHTGTVSGVIAGSGVLAKTGAGNLVLASANTINGTLAVNEGVLTLADAGALGGAKLAGTGTLGIATGGVYSFASTAAGGAFTGVAAVSSGELTLDAGATAVLSTAVLSLDAGGAARKVSGDVSIGGLVFNGGLLALPMNGTAPDGILNVDTLDLGSGGSVGVDIDAFLVDQANPPVPPALNVLDQDSIASILLVAANSVTGAGSITVTAADGSPIPSPAYADIKQDGATIARAGYGYTASGVSGENAGLYMGYGLSELDILEGKTFKLSNAGASDSELSAKITGLGGLEIAAADAVSVVSSTTGVVRYVSGASGTITLSNSGNTYSGKTTVSNGILLGGAANVFGGSSMEVKGGAVLDLGGFAQTVKNLTGDGWVVLGGATLTVDVAADDSGTYNGTLVGVPAGRLVKTGEGRLVLNGSVAYPYPNSIAHPYFAGVVELKAGTLGIGNNAALGTGTLAVTGSNTTLTAVANGLVIPNNITLASNKLTIDSEHAATYSGVISGAGGSIVVKGSGATTLSGSNSYAGGLLVTAGARVVSGDAKGIGSGPVTIETGGALTFSISASGEASNTITGDTLEFSGFARHAKLRLGGDNTVANFTVRNGGSVTAVSTGALGGPNAAVTIAGGGELEITRLGTVADTLDVQRGGRLVFSPSWAENTDPMLVVREAHLADGAVLGLGSLATGEYLLLKADTLTSAGSLAYDAGPYAALGVDVSRFKVDLATGEVTFRMLNHIANPGKDIAAIFDAMSATGGAIHSRISENFLMSLDRVSDPVRGSVWLKMVGSYADNDGNSYKTGYTSDTYGAVVGFDKPVSEKLLLGVYAGALSNRIDTDNDSENKGTQPFAGVYGAAKFNHFYMTADIVFGSMDADTTRFEQTGHATGRYTAATFGGSIEAGAVLGSWTRGSIKPSVALHYMRVSYRDQEETGPGAVSIDDLNSNHVEGLFGVQVTQELSMPWKRPGMIDAVIGYRASLSESSLKIKGRFVSTGGQEFTTDVDKYNRDGLMLGLGMRFAMTDRSVFALGYDFELGNEFLRHTVNATIRLNW